MPISDRLPASRSFAAIASSLFVIAASAWSVAGPAHAQSASNTVAVTIQPTTTALPVVVAEKKGIFAKNDLSVKWSVSQVSISDSIAALGRQFNVAMGTQPALIAAAGQGVPIVAITGGALDTIKVPTSNIVARGGSGIETFKQLEGKTVGTLTLTGNIHFALLNILQKEGVDLNSIRWVTGTVPQLPDLLKAGRVDAIEEIEPFATSAIAAGGTALGDPFRSIGDRAFIGLWLAERTWANENKDLVLRFNKSMDEASQWIVANNAEAREILSSYTGLKGVPLEKTPIPEFHFSSTAEDLSKQLRADLDLWSDILKRTSDFPQVNTNELLPNWAK
ncbi:NMT1 domain-containing protein [Hyphomicrobiales bacterium]|nr:NMT1 domain-containing protein [Hyphomicrobiales bacterium]CAH1677339.1 NMT1 domain-containing protein [Hyphomicrobiales bacterium]